MPSPTTTAPPPPPPSEEPREEEEEPSEPAPEAEEVPPLPPERDPDTRSVMVRAGSGRESAGSASHTTKETTVVSPQRGRKLEPPPMPRRADFGDHYPDGGWGWVVCAAAASVHFLCHGLHLAYGTLFLEVVARFQARKTDTVWLGSLGLAVSFLLSPLVIAVCRRKSPRLQAIVGGLISALGCLFMSFSTEVHQLFISYTVVLSLGTGITLTSAGVIVGRYFYKRRECAEMLMLSGSGIGMAVVSVFIKQVIRVLGWMRGMQGLTGLILPTVAAGALYRSASLYHPRRKAILHVKNMRKTKKQQREFEDKPPYFDFSPLRMRSLQVLMVTTAVTGLGIYTPFLLLGIEAVGDEMSETSVCLLMVFLGIGFACGSLLFGLVVIRSSLRCMVARQYLCQLTSLGCGLITMLFCLADGFNAFSLYVWGYGLLCGGYFYSLKVYTYELVSVKLSERSWGYVNLAQGLPILLGPPIATYLNSSVSDPQRIGFMFAGSAMIVGSLLLFLMPWASGHRSNHEVIQAAHFKSKLFEDDVMFYGMEISDEISSRLLNNAHAHGCLAARSSLHAHAQQHHHQSRRKGASSVTSHNKIKLYQNVARHLGLRQITEEEHWSEIEAMSPMSPTDKVTEFLVQSQSMLQNYCHLRHIDVPGIRLEINNVNRDPAQPPGGTGDHQQDEIKDIKLDVTICRTSPGRGSVKRDQRPSVREPSAKKEPIQPPNGHLPHHHTKVNGPNKASERTTSV